MDPLRRDALPGWPEEAAPTVRQLLDIIEPHSSAGSDFGWTGRSRPEWKLETTLDRHLTNIAPAESREQWSAREEEMICEFRTRALRYADKLETALLNGPRLATLALGQHAGLPTRLLDWTTSPWVAAWFACHEHGDVDGVIWWFDFKRLELEVGEHWDHFEVPYIDRRPELAHLNEYERRDLNCADRDLEWATFAAPEAPWISKLHCHPSPRMSAQKAFHTFSGRLRWTHNDAIDSLVGRSQGRGIPRGRISIAAEIKRDVLERLRAMNIHASGLQYPGIDIAARSIARPEP